jgi:hypothetical protein
MPSFIKRNRVSSEERFKLRVYNFINASNALSFQSAVYDCKKSFWTPWRLTNVCFYLYS